MSDTSLDGAFAAIVFDRIEEFPWTDPKTNTTKVIKSIVGLMEFGDGTRDWVKIGYPRDPNWNPPPLKSGIKIMVPVVASVNRKDNTIRWTARTDIQPFNAPSIG